MSSWMTGQLICDALWWCNRPENVMVHSDRGGQYCSADYQVMLKGHNL